MVLPPTLVPGLSTVALTVAVVAVLGRDLWFFSDDWNILASYHSGGLLEPFNGHLSAVPAGLYQLLFRTVGVDSYVPFRLVGIAALVWLGVEVALLARRRLDSARLGPVAASAVVGPLAVAAVLWNSSGQMNLMFPFLLNFTVPIAALAAIWRHLDRGTRRDDAAASAFLALALATSGLGVMTALAVGAELALSRAPWRRWLVLGPGPLLWAIWFLTHREQTHTTTDPGAVGSYAARMIGAAFESIGAGSPLLGALLVVCFGGYLAAAGLRWRSLDGRLVGALAAPVAFAVLTAVTRIGIVPEIPPDELRYAWAVAAYLVLAALAVARPGPLLARHLPDGLWYGVAAVAAAVVVMGGASLVGDLRDWNAQVSNARPGLSAVLLATEAVGLDRIDPDRRVPISYVPLTSGDYLAAVDAVGSPIAGVDAATIGPGDDASRTADAILVEELPVVVRSGACAGRTSALDEGPSSAGAPVDGDTVEVLAQAGTVLALDAPGEAAVAVARFAAPAAGLLLDVPVGPSLLHLPADAAGVHADGLPWRIQVPDGVRVLHCTDA